MWHIFIAFGIFSLYFTYFLYTWHIFVICGIFTLYFMFTLYLAYFHCIWQIFISFGIFPLYLASFHYILHVFFIFGIFSLYLASCHCVLCFLYIWHTCITLGTILTLRSTAMQHSPHTTPKTRIVISIRLPQTATQTPYCTIHVIDQLSSLQIELIDDALQST